MNVLNGLREVFKQGEDVKELNSDDVVDCIWCFGRRNGTNILLNRVPNLSRHSSLARSLESSSSSSSLSSSSSSNNGNSNNNDNDNNSSSSTSTIKIDGDERKTTPNNDDEPEEEARDDHQQHHQPSQQELLLSVFDKVNNAVVNGFHMATNAGPLANEPLMGVCFIIENMDLEEWDHKNGYIYIYTVYTYTMYILYVYTCPTLPPAPLALPIKNKNKKNDFEYFVW